MEILETCLGSGQRLRDREAVEAEYVEDWEWGSCGMGAIWL